MSSAKKLGERKIIKIILNSIEQMPDMPIPFGDDASAIEIGNKKLVVINTDMLVKKTDIPPSMTIYQAARKAAVMSISDLAAKGANPIALLASIGVPPDLTETEIREIGKGLNDGAREYGAYLIGGDTNESHDLIISCTATGTCNKNHLIRRNGAQPGDILAVTGTFGKTAAGLKILSEKLSVTKDWKPLVESVLMPKTRVSEGMALAKCGAATAAIDSSDGLAWSLHELSRASGVGFILHAVPVAPEAVKFAKVHGLDPTELALYGGEEYELVVTVKQTLWTRARKAVEDAGGTLLKVGQATEEKKVLLWQNRELVSVEALGWEHFKAE